MGLLPAGDAAMVGTGLFSQRFLPVDGPPAEAVSPTGKQSYSAYGLISMGCT